MRVATAALLLLASAEGSIYPDGHWDRATKVGSKNANDFVKENVDKGKTVFIRAIASEG